MGYLVNKASYVFLRKISFFWIKMKFVKWLQNSGDLLKDLINLKMLINSKSLKN